MKTKKTIPLALKQGQTTLFGDYYPLTKEEKRIEKMIGKIRVEKLWMCWILDNDNLAPDLSVNDVLDNFLDFRAEMKAKLRKLGYVYIEDEENHSHYDCYAAKEKKPTAVKFVSPDEDEVPF